MNKGHEHLPGLASGKSQASADILGPKAWEHNGRAYTQMSETSNHSLADKSTSRSLPHGQAVYGKILPRALQANAQGLDGAPDFKSMYALLLDTVLRLETRGRRSQHHESTGSGNAWMMARDS